MKKNYFKSFMAGIVHEFEKENRHSSAHVYKSTENAFTTYIEVKRIQEFTFNAQLLKGFESYLIEKRLSWNTVSTYMRMLRATYNRAVEKGIMKYVPYLFKGVYTGVQSKVKRALPPQAMAKFMDSRTLETYPESKWFVLMFLLRGIPFVDLAHLRKCDLNGGVITYHRHKTNRELVVSIPEEARDIIRRSLDTTSSPYLFPILNGTIRNGKDAYKNYQSTLRKFNYRIEKIGREIGIDVKLSSYTARHTWATTAYYQNLGTGIICNALGHSSIKVTEAYLKPFDNERLSKANGKVISYIKGYSSCEVTW